MTLTFTSLWCPVTICLYRQAMCGSLFAVMIQRFLGSFWLPPLMILIYVKGRHFPCPSSSNLGWKEWVDEELFDTGFMVALRQAGVLKAIISSHCLSTYKDFFNLHLVCWWCSASYTFFLSCGKITMTLEDVVNQLLLPILSDMDPSNIVLSTEEEAELRKGMSGNVKLSH